MAAETAQTLDRGLRILGLVAGSESRFTINEIAESLGISRTVAYRLIVTLEEHDLLHRDEQGRIGAGFGMMAFRNAYLPELKSRATPALTRLADASGTTAHLTIADGEDAVALVVVEPSRSDMHVAYRVGARHRLDAGAAGKAILLGRAAKDGVASTSGELQPGAAGLAAPVRGVPGLEASVGIVSLHDIDAKTVEPLVLAAAQAVAEALA
ncbi:IclR family transcriptional regulator [Aeromicrobium ginsengisoli]|uniref:Helix-turn-helix domain-containing protein n=1 Tax=Aeromicrobium ginsengisoli TaxID=363867 RepID=A0A5M4F9A7_9ACTN|nr:helix-turn-helix domain-containing protein [Aeromicrobium ginsengisoli]KAA1394355.1 helix-turn-helix domain-containing protein [Aeromicrobium ginsengisoli]